MADLRTVLRIIARDETKGALTKTQKELKGIGTTLGNLRNQALALAGINFGIGGLASLVALADGYQLTTARLKLLSGETENFAGLQKQVFEIAQDTFTTYEQTSALYGNLAASTKAVGVTQTELLSVTKALNQSYQISGSTQQEAAASTIQLVQALASGQIRGQEFNSVAEQGRRILFALKDATGKTAGELREFANAGKLTTEFFLKAFLPEAEKIDEEFRTLPLTVGRSLTQLQNAFEQYAGQQNQELGITRDIALVFQDLALGFEDFADSVVTYGGAAIAFLSAQFLGTVGKAAEKRLALAIASRTSAVADLEAARAQAKLAAASRISAIATERRVASLLHERQASLAVAQSEVARAAIQKEVDFLQAQSVIATNARVAANGRLAASNAAVTATTLTAVGATRLWNAAIALLGGPIGVALVGIAALGAALAAFNASTETGSEVYSDFVEDLEAGKKAADEQKTSIDSLASTLEKLKYSAQFAEISKGELAVKRLKEEILSLEEELARGGGEILDPLSGEAAPGDIEYLSSLRDKAADAQKKVEALKEEVLGLIDRDKELQNEFGGGVAGIPKRLRDVIDEQKKANSELAGVEKNRRKLVESLDKLSEELGGPSIDIEKQTDAFNVASLNTIRNQIQGDIGKGDAESAIRNIERAKDIVEQLQKTEGSSDSYLKTQVELLKELAADAGEIELPAPKIDKDAVRAEAANIAEVWNGIADQYPFLGKLTVDQPSFQAEVLSATQAAQELLDQRPLLIRWNADAPSADGASKNAYGGFISGAGSGTSDSILSWLSNGEYVVRAAAVQHYGSGFLDRLNRMNIPKFARGGAVSGAAGASQGSPIIFNLNGQQIQATVSGPGVSDLRTALHRENMKRGSRA